MADEILTDEDVFGTPTGAAQPAGAPSITGLPEPQDQEPGLLSDEDVFGSSDSALRTTLRAATRVNAGRDPALVAESERLARKYGLPSDTAERQIDSLREQEDMAAVDTLATRSPKVAEWMASDPNAAAIAKDDREGLTALEQSFILAPAFRYVADLGQAAAAGLVSGTGSAVSGAGEVLNMADRRQQGAMEAGASAGEAFWRLFSDDLGDRYAANVQAQRDMMPSWLQDQGPFGLVGGWWRTVGGAIEGFANDTIAPAEERQNLATDVASGLGSLVPYVAATLYTGGAGALGLGATQGIDVQADRAEAAGTYGTAASDAGQVLGGAVTAATERLGIGWLMRRLPPGVKQTLNQRVADIVMGGAGEAAQEVTESALQDVITRVLVDESFDPFQGIEREGLAAFGVGLLFRGGVHAMRQEYDARQALVESETLGNIEAAIGNLKMAELSPERLREVLGRLKSSTVSDVYLPVDRFTALFQSDQDLGDALSSIGVDRAELSLALAENGQVRVPIEGYFTAMTPEQRAAAKPYARLTPAAMTPEEAKSFDREQALREFIEATGEQGRPESDPTNWVYDQVRAQLEAAGTDPAVAEQQAELYAAALRTAVVRSGLSLEQLAGTEQDPRLTIRRDTPDAVRRVAEARNVDVALDASIEALRSGRLFSDQEVGTAEPVDGMPAGTLNVNRAAFNEATNELGRMLDEIGISREQLAEMDNAAVRAALGMTGEPGGEGVEFDQSAPVESQAFRDWFQASKVANPDGTPLVVFHGTGEEFGAFDRATLGRATGHASSGLGFFFTPDRDGAQAYADKAADYVPANAQVLEVYLSIQNPYTMTLDEAQSIEDVAEAAVMRMSLQAQGFDGVWVPEQNAWVAFEPTQVKSVENRGAWSRKDPRMLYQSVFHGSPHRGIEREGFSLQKIGTGEGAQAYGWGLYFAGKREIAEWYRKGLSHRDMVQKFRDAMPDRADTDEALEWANSGGAQPEMAAVIRALASDDWLGFDYPSQALNALFVSPENYDISLDLSRAASAMQGQLYAAEIPDDGDLLDYDATLDQQPGKVREALKHAFVARGMPLNENGEPLFFARNPTGQSMYAALGGIRGERAASEAMRAAGIPGLRYLDGTSRGAGDGSRNYVIWDEGAISDVRTFYQSEQQRTPEFREWFDGSKVVDENGEPLVVYHGTPDGRFLAEDGVFKSQKERLGFGKETGVHWFASDQHTSRTYMDPARSFDYQNAEPAMVPAYLRMVNPLVIDAGGQKWRDAQKLGTTGDVIRQAQEAGHDGIIIRNVRDDYQTGVVKGDKPTTTYAVFNSNQIKSVTNERPTSGPSIYNQQLDDTKRGSVNIIPGYPGGMDRYLITLGNRADKSTFLHESAHVFLELRKQINAQVAAIPEGERTKDQQRIVDDDARILELLGVDSFDAIQRDQHEAFAESFEAYLREGKAPSPRLKRAFQSFRMWLTRIYRTLKGLPNANLTDEVRGYFDRMLATDEEIDAVREQLSLQPLLTGELRGEMTDEEYRRYLLAVAVSRDAAIEQEGAVQFAYAAREAERMKSAEMRELRAEVEAEINADPVWRAIAMLRTGKTPDGQPLPADEVFKLDTQSVTDVQGKEWVKNNLGGMHRREGGVHPDMAASVLGFKSATEMLQAIVSKPKKRDAIEDEALRRWQERNPDPMLDGALEARVTKAVHNDAAAEMMLREVNALSGAKKIALAQLRELVARSVGQIEVRNLNPNRHKAAEMKHGREAVRAAAKGDKIKASQARRSQLMAHLTYRAELDAKERAEAFRAEGLRLAKKPAQERLARAGWESYLDKVNQILASFDLRRMSNKDIERKKSLRAWVEAQQEAGEITALSEGLIARVEAGRVTNWREARVEEIDAAADALANIQHLARIKNKLTAARDGREWDEARTDLIARMQESLPDTIGGEVSARDVGDIEQARRGVAGALANLNRPENVVEALDGGETGPWHDYLWTVLQDAENKAAGYRNALGTKLKGLRAEAGDVFKTTQDKLVVKLPNERGQVVDVTVSRATLIGIALNTGNATNMQRLVDGGIVSGSQRFRLGPSNVQQLLSELRADELAFVQGMWDTVNSLWPDIVNLQRRMSGLPPEKVEARELTVRSKDGKSITLSGGYWPLVYDSNRSAVGETQDGADAMRIMMGAGFTKAFTPKGYQKARAEVFEAPLQLDFAQVMSRHMDHVITDLSHREAVRDINRILSDSEIKEQLILRVGREGYDNLRGSLSYAVSASSAVAGRVARRWHPLIDTVLTNTSVAALAIRPDIALGNLTSATIQGLDRVGVKALMRGWWALETARTRTTEAIVAKSAFMAQRLGDTDHQFQQELQRLAGRRGWGPAYRRMMMALHRAADAEVTRALWWGRYQQALEAGEGEAQAVLMADKAVRQTQTASGRKDISTFERDTSFKQARQFMGPMFVIFGRLYAAAKGEGATQRVGARTSTLLLQVFLAPAIFALAAGRGPEDGDDDEEIGAGDWARWLAVNVGLFPLMTLPWIRELTALGEAFIMGGQVNPRANPTTQAVVSMGRAFASLGDNVENYMETGEVDYLDATRDIFLFLGPIVGAPASQVRITTKTIENVLDDPEQDKVELAKMAVYGPPRETR